MTRIIGHFRRARAAFTLMEVNLAVFIMAVGVLAMASLYPLGFRESQQSRDDVHAAITANEVLGQLTAALSSRNIEWKKWKECIEDAVEESNKGGAGDGWFSYFEGGKNNSYQVRRRGSVNDHAQSVFGKLVKAVEGATEKPSWNPDSKYAYGLVVQWGKRIVATSGQNKTCEAMNDYSRVSISFRMSRRPGALMAAPIYYTEVHFQGDYGDQGSTK